MIHATNSNAKAMTTKGKAIHSLILAIGLILFALSAHGRTPLTGNVTYSVPGDFQSMQQAWDHVQRNIDLNCHNVTVQVADGSYGPFVAKGALTGGCSVDAVTFRGNVGTPSMVPVSGVGVNAISVFAGANLKLEGFMLVAVQSESFNTGGHGLIVYQGSQVKLGNMAWYVCDWAHLVVSEGAHVHAERSYQSILTGSRIFALVEAGGKLWMNGATIMNTVPVTYTNAFILVSQQGLADFSGTIMNAIGGPISGLECGVSSNSVLILLNMAWPGPGGCTVTSGGQIL